MIWFGCVLWHFNHCKLFNANSCLLVILFLNEQDLICLHTVKWFQVLLFITNPLFCTLLNSSKTYLI